MIRRGDRRIDDGEQLEVLRIAERDDPIPGPPLRVHAAGYGGEPELLEHARGRRIEIAHRVDDVIDLQHAITPRSRA